MGDLGELLLTLIILGIVAYYRIPGLRQWLRGQSIVMSHAPPNRPVSERPPERVSHAAERPSERPVETHSETPGNDTWSADEVIDQLAVIWVIGPDGSPRRPSIQAIARVVGLRTEYVADRVRAARGESPPDGLRVKDGRGERVIAR